jgi:hypothetical protein
MEIQNLLGEYKPVWKLRYCVGCIKKRILHLMPNKPLNEEMIKDMHTRMEREISREAKIPLMVVTNEEFFLANRPEGCKETWYYDMPATGLSDSTQTLRGSYEDVTMEASPRGTKRGNEDLSPEAEKTPKRRVPFPGLLDSRESSPQSTTGPQATSTPRPIPPPRRESLPLKTPTPTPRTSKTEAPGAPRPDRNPKIMDRLSPRVLFSSKAKTGIDQLADIQESQV